MNEQRSDVQVGARVIPYDRLGTGPAIVVLTSTRKGRAPWLRRLVGGFRVVAFVADDLPPGDPGDWVGRTFDALGLDRAPLVADGPSAEAALRLALRDPWRIAALALVLPVPAGAPEGLPSRTVLDPVGVPALFLPWPPPAPGGEADPSRPLVEFLEEVCGVSTKGR